MLLEQHYFYVQSCSQRTPFFLSSRTLEENRSSALKEAPVYSNNERMLHIFEGFLEEFGIKVEDIISESKTLTKTLLMGIVEQEDVFREEKPKIGVFGKIRSGKSTLGNAIFGEERFQTGHAIELTENISKVTLLPAGVEIYDTPGFEGFNPEHTEQARQFMRECDLLLYVIRYPGAVDIGARTFYEQEIKPLGKPVVTVVNFDDSVSQADAARVFASAVRVLKLPNMVQVCAITKVGVDALLLSVLNHLPGRYHALFQAAVDKRYHERMSKHRAFRLAVSAAALATCTKVNRAVPDPKDLKDSWNALVVLVGGLPLEIARVYLSGFDAGEQVERIATELRSQREDLIRSEGSSGPFDFIGAIMGGLLGAAATQSGAIVALFGVGATAGPAGIIVTLAGGGLTAALGWLLGRVVKKHASEQIEIQAKLGGFDAAIGLLSVGAATVATIQAQAPDRRVIVPQQSLDYFRKAYTLYYEHQVRALLEPYRDELEHATEGDRSKILHLLSECEPLRQHFATLDKRLPTL
jgi:hypothetical protein